MEILHLATDKLEMVQWRAARYITNCYRNKSSLSSMLDHLQIESLCTVTCMLFIFLFIIDILFTYFLSDLDIDSKQVVYICFKILLEE